MTREQYKREYPEYCFRPSPWNCGFEDGRYYIGGVIEDAYGRQRGTWTDSIDANGRHDFQTCWHWRISD